MFKNFQTGSVTVLVAQNEKAAFGSLFFLFKNGEDEPW